MSTGECRVREPNASERIGYTKAAVDTFLLAPRKSLLRNRVLHEICSKNLESAYLCAPAEELIELRSALKHALNEATTGEWELFTFFLYRTHGRRHPHFGLPYMEFLDLFGYPLLPEARRNSKVILLLSWKAWMTLSRLWKRSSWFRC